MTDSSDDLKAMLLQLTPAARRTLRDVLIRDQADRDAIAQKLWRLRDDNGSQWADVIDLFTMYPEARRQAVRLIAEMQADQVFQQW